MALDSGVTSVDKDRRNVPTVADTARGSGDAELQLILTEMSSVAFVASILATICFASVISPPQRFEQLEGWTSEVPWKALWIGWEVQHFYGALWCTASSAALVSALFSFAIIYGCLVSHSKGDASRDAFVHYLKTAPFSELTCQCRRAPSPVRKAAVFASDIALFCFCLFSVWRPRSWNMPVHFLVSSILALTAATAFNMFVLLPYYIVTHTVLTIAGFLILVPGIQAISQAAYPGDSRRGSRLQSQRFLTRNYEQAPQVSSATAAAGTC